MKPNFLHFIHSFKNILSKFPLSTKVDNVVWKSEIKKKYTLGCTIHKSHCWAALWMGKTQYQNMGILSKKRVSTQTKCLLSCQNLNKIWKIIRGLLGKNRRLSSTFDSCWRNEVSSFHLRKYAQVGPFCELYKPDVDINTKNNLDNSGSNETMQKGLASII